MIWRKFRHRFASMLLALLACGGAACNQHQPPPGPRQLLYAAVPDQRSVMIFDASARGAASPLKVIKENAPDIPVGVALDGQGKLYVANRDGNIAIYDGRGSNYQLMRRLAGPHTQLARITAIAVDNTGGLFIGDMGAGQSGPRLIMFSGNMSGNVMPDHTIGGKHTGLTSPVGISIDATGRTFVADHDSGKILVFDAVAQGDVPPLTAIDVTHPDGVLIDQELDLYADSGATHSVMSFIPIGPQNWSHNSAITTAALQAPRGIASDKDGNLAVAIAGGIAFFTANASGAVTPSRILEGPAPFNPAGIVIK